MRPGSASFEGSLGGISLAELGIDFHDLQEGGRFATPRRDSPMVDTADLTVASNYPEDRSPSAHEERRGIIGNPTQGFSLYGDRPKTLWPKGKVFQNWQWPVKVPASMPILEIVTNRVARSIISEKYYMTDGVCGPAIDILSEFPLNRGFEVSVQYTSDEFPAWFDLAKVDPNSLVDAEGNSRVSVVVSQYLKAQCEELVERLNLVYEMVDFQKLAYIHGDAFINRVDWVENENYTWDHTREYTENTISELQGLNPTAIWIVRNEVGETTNIVSVKQTGADPDELDLEHTIHLKHKGSSYTTYGFPHTLRVLKEMMVKEAYLNAAQAWGERYALPIRLLKYGVLVRAGDNSGPVATPAMRAAAEEAIKNYDPLSGHTIVAPFHWEYQFVGADGANAMIVSNELLEANRRILAGLGVPSAFLMGDWTNYATARIQYSGLMHRLKTIQENLRRILINRIFLPFFKMRGYVDNVGNAIKVDVRWKRGHLEDDQSMMDFLAKIADIPGVLSLQSIREGLGFDNQIEEERLDSEADRVARRQMKLSAYNEQFPSSSPAMMPPGMNVPNPQPGMPQYDEYGQPVQQYDEYGQPLPTQQTQPTQQYPGMPTVNLPQPAGDIYQNWMNPQPTQQDQLKQQILMRRIKQSLERIQDKLQDELQSGHNVVAASLENPSFSDAQRDMIERKVYKRIAGLKLMEKAYVQRIEDINFIQAMIAEGSSEQGAA